MKFTEYLNNNINLNESPEKEMDQSVYDECMEIAQEIHSLINVIEKVSPDAKRVDPKKHQTLVQAEKDLIQVRNSLQKVKLRGYK